MKHLKKLLLVALLAAGCRHPSHVEVYPGPLDNPAMTPRDGGVLPTPESQPVPGAPGGAHHRGGGGGPR
jgi:hypothetical protein